MTATTASTATTATAPGTVRRPFELPRPRPSRAAYAAIDWSAPTRGAGYWDLQAAAWLPSPVR